MAVAEDAFDIEADVAVEVAGFERAGFAREESEMGWRLF